MSTTTMTAFAERAVLIGRANAIERERQRVEHRRDGRPHLSPETREALTRAAALLSLAADDLREAAGMEVDG